MAFIKFPRMEEGEPRYWGDPAASASAIIYGCCIIVLNSKQLEATKGPSDNLWYIRTMEYYVAIKRRELYKCRCKDLQDRLFSEKTHTEKCA